MPSRGVQEKNVLFLNDCWWRNVTTLTDQRLDAEGIQFCVRLAQPLQSY